MKNIILGLVVGLVVFFGPGLTDGNFGLIGSEYFLNYLPNGLLGLMILGLIYVLIGGVIFLVLQTLLNKSSNYEGASRVNSTLKFCLGIVLAYAAVIVLVLRAFSNFGF
ncbi:MAG: hypothetical protein Q8R55_00065 [Candidatus Taylorbacteria bacterium]|nr:hypothetical protein [Candidatus Taylorbacteria bacterium]